MIAPPDRRDADAQEIADRMLPFVAAEGFAAEWTLHGPGLVKAHIDKSVADAKKRLDAAWSELRRAEGKKSNGFSMLHYSLATGRSITTDAPEQGESRLILDASCEREKLATLRGLCRLLRDPEQQILASAGEITIATAPLDQANWILKNSPHPDGRGAGLRAVILLPPSGDDNHYANVHRIAHLAAVNARLASGKSTLVWLSGLHFSEIRDLAKEIEKPRGSLRVMQTEPAKLLSAIHPDGSAGALALAAGEGHAG